MQLFTTEYTLLMVSSIPANGPVTLQQEGGDGAERMEREAMQRSHSQLPYFLGKPAQEHTVIKSGYCVKQGAVVSSHPVLFVRAGRRPHQGLLSSCVEDIIEEGSLGAVKTEMMRHCLVSLTLFFLGFLASPCKQHFVSFRELFTHLV